jgi:hypothetical protein
MKVFLIAAVAVAISGAAFAEDLKGTVMTDSEMDKVTAGAGFGVGTALKHTGNASHSFTGLDTARSQSGKFVGAGLCTAGRAFCP